MVLKILRKTYRIFFPSANFSSEIKLKENLFDEYGRQPTCRLVVDF